MWRCCAIALLAAIPVCAGEPVRLPVQPAATDLVGELQPPSFLNDVVPILTRQGCNQGSCHGKGAGQNGFRLSLRGYAPDMDYRPIAKAPAASSRPVVVGFGPCGLFAGLILAVNPRNRPQ